MPNRSFVMKAYAGAIDQEVSTDVDVCRKQYGCAEQRSNDRSEESQESAVVLRPEHAMHGKSSGSHRTAGASSRGDFSFKRTLRRTMQDVL